MMACEKHGLVYVQFGGNTGSPPEGYCYQCEIDALRAEVAEQTDRAEDFLTEMRAMQQRWIDRGRKLGEAKSDLAAAVEVLRKIATHPIYGIDPIEIVQIARSFLARLEVSREGHVLLPAMV
jgi:hypothetical protein